MHSGRGPITVQLKAILKRGWAAVKQATRVDRALMKSIAVPDGLYWRTISHPRRGTIRIKDVRSNHRTGNDALAAMGSAPAKAVDSESLFSSPFVGRDRNRNLCRADQHLRQRTRLSTRAYQELLAQGCGYGRVWAPDERGRIGGA